MKTMKLVVAGLSLLATSTMTLQPAHAGPIPPTSTGSRVPNMPNVAKRLVNGAAHVGTSCSGEFPNYDRSMKFFERPAKICVRWDDRQPVASATWELYEDKPTGSDTKLASGAIPAAKITGGTHSTFDITLEGEIPKWNETSADKKYYVRIVSKLADSDHTMISGRGNLIHRPKGDQPKPQPKNPYQCGSAPDNYKRLVQLHILQTTVSQTTNTSGDGDRDEMYIKVDRLGPGVAHDSKRLPGEDDYYEAHQDKEYKEKYTNQDGKQKGKPVFWAGYLKHNQIVDLGVTVLEQDNSDLANIKNQIIEAMLKVEKAALETENPYGAIVGAAAGLVALHASLIPNTKGHDYLGSFVLRVENKCGHIRTTWTTFPKVDIPGIGTLYNDFIDSIDHAKIEGRVSVLSRPAEGFTDNTPIDWGGWTPRGLTDKFWWSARGTSGAKYMFTLGSRLFTKQEEAAYEAAKDALPGG